MAISHVQDSTSSTSTSSPTTLTLSSGVSVGDLVAVFFGYGTATAPSFSTTTGTSSAWTIKHGSDGSNQYAAVAYATVTGVGGGNSFAVQVTFTGGIAVQMTLSEFSGVGAFDQTNSNTSNSGSSMPTGSITPAASTQYLWLAECSTSSVTTVSSGPGGWTAVGAANAIALGAYLITSSTGAQNPSFTLSTALPNATAAMLVDFLAPVAAPPTPVQPLVVSRQAILSAF